ncbi:4-diphosphocytidyl-2-C-methyl-D-erythritol kinase [Paracoccus halophilus]|uniref:4-diphosphocytidyl-2-C-methyl-D-erythritol kinase n=1 Tax=Paracoccus halophilus TaxID=376733 RepID=A0A099EXK4_9RHOB|nr:4-(cytidine 5'-diphospho)-2-C-methyl-D-erythritol kinase [Paracoccus halophilus]KGJ03155.1 4-diphosphocytidyl-2C-methyl-D-erythritol kinase [Paracoccus halophilus]SFA59108.1 4-diphosphocytidyl-2-C-methyl-D-erythritol kinase [Paracoccus halophilus]
MSLPRREFAPAKLNLTLHVTGRRPDSYHLLDSLVVFLDIGDVVTVAKGPLALAVTGPFAAALAGQTDNLCLRAARLAGREVAIGLEKNLPVASGVGGGSADAAAVLRALDADPGAAASLGADLPVCMAGVATRMRGLGEILAPLPDLPPLHAVLVNPGRALSTPAVYAALERRDNPPMPDPLPDFPDAAALIGFLRACRNDLQAPAISLMPEIADCLAALRDSGAALSRMSGSGATCFGLYAAATDARAAAAGIARARPGWWVETSGLAPPKG